MSFDEATFCSMLPQLSFTQMCDALYTGCKEQGKEFIIHAQTQSAIVKKWSQIASFGNKIILPCLLDLEYWLTVLPYFEKGTDKGQLITKTSAILFETRIPSKATLEGMLLNLPRLTDSLDVCQKDYLLLAIDFLIEQHNAEKKEFFSVNTIAPILSYLLKELPSTTGRDWLCMALINAIDKKDNQDLPTLAKILCALGEVKPSPIIDRFFAALWPQVIKQLLEGKKLDKDHPLKEWMEQYAPPPETSAYKMATRLFPALKEKFEAEAKAQAKTETKEIETTIIKSPNKFSTLIKSFSAAKLGKKDSLKLTGEKPRPSLNQSEVEDGSQ